MRVTIKWYSVIVTLLFIGQAILIILLLQPQPNLHSQAQFSQPSSISTTPSCNNQIKDEPRVSATEVKRQVLKKKGEHVAEVPETRPPLCSKNLVVATYNLWNINPPWTTRASKIVELIEELQPHFVGLQEIRKYERQNQLDILKAMLKTYKHSVYEKVQEEQRGEEEGLGILSKYPIVETSSINFGNTNRKCLRGLIETPQGPVNFFVTHFSLNDLEQCGHALLLWKFMNSFPSNIPQILVGDMNTYFDFEWPMDFLTQGLTPFMLGPFNPCSTVLNEMLAQDSNGNKTGHHFLKDVWEVMYPPFPESQMKPSAGRWWGGWPAPPGHTFSNYGDQDPSRTDRMYFYSPSKDQQQKHKQQPTLQLCEVTLFGDVPIAGQSPKIFPSDHKGVAGHFLLEE